MLLNSWYHHPPRTVAGQMKEARAKYICKSKDLFWSGGKGSGVLAQSLTSPKTIVYQIVTDAFFSLFLNTIAYFLYRNTNVSPKLVYKFGLKKSTNGNTHKTS